MDKKKKKERETWNSERGSQTFLTSAYLSHIAP